MAVSATLTVSLRDLSLLPDNDRDLQALVIDLIAEELKNKIKDAIDVSTRAVTNPELDSRGVSVSLGLKVDL